MAPLINLPLNYNTHAEIQDFLMNVQLSMVLWEVKCGKFLRILMARLAMQKKSISLVTLKEGYSTDKELEYKHGCYFRCANTYIFVT
jgi:hypothetical protein